jgi:hypothetical protein
MRTVRSHILLFKCCQCVAKDEMSHQNNRRYVATVHQEKRQAKILFLHVNQTIHQLLNG